MKRKVEVHLDIPVSIKAPIEIDITCKDVTDWISECKNRSMLTPIQKLTEQQLKNTEQP